MQARDLAVPNDNEGEARTMDTDITVTETIDGLTRVRICRSRRGNSLTPDVARDIGAAIERSGESARCVVLESEGGIFCAGADLDFLLGLQGTTAEQVEQVVYECFQGMIRTICDCPVPVVARLQGGAAGAGADLLLACDLVVASEAAWIQESWIEIGAISALAGAHHLTRSVGRVRALDLLLSSRRVDASEALAMGLVNRVVHPDQLDNAIVDLCALVLNRDTDAVRTMKALVRVDDHRSRESALSLGARLQSGLLPRPQVHARVERIRQSLATR